MCLSCYTEIDCFLFTNPTQRHTPICSFQTQKWNLPTKKLHQGITKIKRQPIPICTKQNKSTHMDECREKCTVNKTLINYCTFLLGIVCNNIKTCTYRFVCLVSSLILLAALFFIFLLLVYNNLFCATSQAAATYLSMLTAPSFLLDFIPFHLQ